MAFNDRFTPGDRLDLQTVYFKGLLNILDATPKFSDTYAAFTYYYRVRAFIAIAKIALSTEALASLNGIIAAFTEKWHETEEAAQEENEADPIKGPTIPQDAAAITILCANQLLGETMRYLDESGIVRTRKKGAIAAWGEIDEKGRLNVRLKSESDYQNSDEDDEDDDFKGDELNGEPDDTTEGSGD